MKRYYDYAAYLKNRYGEKVCKLPVRLNVTCPNRDGTRGTGGCAFCGAGDGCYTGLRDVEPIADQLAENRAYMSRVYKAKKFIAYLQDHTNTYLPPDDFRRVLESCVEDDIVEIAVSTRPDCVPEPYLAIADEIKAKTGREITFEFGLQSVNTHTLRAIGRGHTLAETVDAILRVKAHGFQVGVHLIPNLPTDDETDVIEAAQLMNVLRVDTVKLHNLFLMKGTRMGDDYAAGRFKIGDYETYFATVALFLRHLSPAIAVERFFARCPAPGCLFSNWGRSWKFLQNELMTYLDTYDVVQGSLYDAQGGILYK